MVGQWHWKFFSLCFCVHACTHFNTHIAAAAEEKEENLEELEEEEEDEEWGGEGEIAEEVKAE